MAKGGSKVSMNRKGLEISIKQTGERVTRGVATVMSEEGKKIAELARDYAPVDKGNLEDAIQVEETNTGLNGRREVTVFVDESVAAGGDKAVGDYALLMHEALYPYGSAGPDDKRFQLGPKSQAKRAGGKKVGGKFLTRALSDRRAEFMAKVAKKVKNS